MSLFHSPKISTDGLLLNIDFSNVKSFQRNLNLQNQNLLLQSEDLHLSPWQSTGSASMTQTAIVGPLGTGLATRIITSTNSPSLIYQEIPVTTSGTGEMYCSVYAKQDTSSSFTLNGYFVGDNEINITFNLSNGTTNTPAGSFIENVGNGWYRCTIIVQPRVNAGATFLWRIWPEARANATGKGCLFWGAQLRNSYAPSTYIKTTSSIINYTPNQYGSFVLNSVNNDSFTINNPQYYSISDGSIEFSRDSIVKTGGYFNITTTGSLTASNFLYNNHTWEILFRINDINPSSYDATEGESVIAVYRGYHSGFFYIANQLRYWVWSGATNMYNVASLTLGTSGTQIIQGRWNHVSVTKNNNTWSIYLNGNKISTTTQAISSVGIGVTNDLRFGSGNFSTQSYSYFSKYNLALSRMYNRALSDNEIIQNFNSVRGRYGI